MSPPHTSPLTYRPAYLGLFAALTLALACNAFLDIRYGSFGKEVLIWAGVFAYTLWLAWRQGGQVSDAGRMAQKWVLGIGLLLTVLLFIPMWGFPRAGLYLLAVLQSALNCVTTSRRQLHWGLLVSLVMVIFAATHFRADWTMLFYLIPYTAAVVFTLVAEQINQRAQQLQQQSLGQPLIGGQGAAIAAATAVILMLGGLLYVATPQLTWPYLHWRFGQKSTLGHLSAQGVDAGSQGQQGGQGQNGGGNGEAGEGSGGDSGGGVDEENGQSLLSGRDWPSPAEMRAAAQRPGMPQWQASTMNTMADLAEAMAQTLAPLGAGLQQAWQSLRKWLQAHHQEIRLALFSLLALVLLAALAFFLRELKFGLWLRLHLDYLRLTRLPPPRDKRLAVQRYYQAMERLCAFHDGARPATANVREYQLLLATTPAIHVREVGGTIETLSRVFEQARYSQRPLAPVNLEQMHCSYRHLYQALMM